MTLCNLSGFTKTALQRWLSVVCFCWPLPGCDLSDCQIEVARRVAPLSEDVFVTDSHVFRVLQASACCLSGAVADSSACSAQSLDSPVSM